jgi:hypothetical protein
MRLPTTPTIGVKSAAEESFVSESRGEGGVILESATSESPTGLRSPKGGEDAV